MSCIATFNINGEKIEVIHDGSLLSNNILDKDVITLLKKLYTNAFDNNIIDVDQDGNNKSLWTDFTKLVQTALRNKTGYCEPVSLSSLMSRDGLVANSNVQFLQDQFSDVVFPEDINVDILLLDNLKLGGKEQFGRFIKSNGKEIFIIKNDKTNTDRISQFAKFLYLRSQLKNNFNLSENSEYYKILNAMKGEGTIIDVIENFSINPSKYSRKTVTIDGNKILVYPRLQNLLREITNIPLRKQYEDVFTNDINQYLRYDLDKKNNRKIILKISDLYQILQANHPDLVSTFKTLKDFKNYFKDETYLEESDEYKNGYDKLLSQLLDKTFPYVYKKHSDNEIIFMFPSNTIEYKYDISYETISLMEIINPDYFGFKIYSYYDSVDEKTYYFPSKHYLTEQTITTRYKTEEEALAKVNEIIASEDLYENSFIHFNQAVKINTGKTKTEIIEQDGKKEKIKVPIYRMLGLMEDGSIKSPKFIPEGTIIEVRDMDNDLNIDIDQLPYSQLFRKGFTKNDFIKVLNSIPISNELRTEILEKIVTSEDILLLVSQIKKDSLEPDIKSAVDNILKARKKAYYIESVSVSNENGEKIYKYKVIETTPNEVDQYKKDKSVPIVTLMTSISESFKSKFNTNVNLLTYDKLKEKFPDIDPSVKAFIRDGEIYINLASAKSEDLLHEYTHLLLGVLKANPESAKIYEQLMQMVINTDEGSKELKIIRNSYPNISEMDLMEETFASLFSRYLQGRGSDINDIFRENRKFLAGENKNIFDLAGDTDLKTQYNKSILSIFERFSSDVAVKLKQEDGLDFAETINIRKKTNWINKQISEGEIKEDCNG